MVLLGIGQCPWEFLWIAGLLKAWQACTKNLSHGFIGRLEKRYQWQ